MAGKYGGQDFSGLVLYLRKPPVARLLRISGCVTHITHLCLSALAAVTLTKIQHGGAPCDHIMTPLGRGALMPKHLCVTNTI